MKATGIVRRVDDLGRIVIPKEIRRTLRIREGGPLLIPLTVTDGYLWLWRCSKSAWEGIEYDKADFLRV